MIKNGTRLQSQVCDTQVIVVRSADSLDNLRAGGVPMVPIGTDASGDATLDPEFSGGTVMGKRYVDETGAEVHVKGGGRNAERRHNRAESEGSKAAPGQRLTRWPHEATQPARSVCGRPCVRLRSFGR